jgi:tetratricopeptide (TPR) repeat protein
MSRWILGLLVAGLAMAPATLAAQDQTSPQATPAKPQLEERTPPKTSGKQAVPAEEDKSFLKEEHSFNPLQSKKSIDAGDTYWHLGKIQGALYRYQDATLWNDGNAEAWLKLGKAEEKMKDIKAAKDAYSKYLELAPDAKEAAAVRKKLQSLK